MENGYKRMTYDEYESAIDKLVEDLLEYLNKNELKVDYVCPILRSGAVPAVYIANKLNVVKFLPFQIKHVTHKNGEAKIETLLNPLSMIKIDKKNPTFLLVDALNYTGTSALLCVESIKESYPDANILFVCLYKEYGENILEDKVTYFNHALYCNIGNHLTKEECEMKGVEYLPPLFPWEILEIEIDHPDDLEENIYF